MLDSQRQWSYNKSKIFKHHQGIIDAFNHDRQKWSFKVKLILLFVCRVVTFSSNQKVTKNCFSIIHKYLSVSIRQYARIHITVECIVKQKDLFNYRNIHDMSNTSKKNLRKYQQQTPPLLQKNIVKQLSHTPRETKCSWFLNLKNLGNCLQKYYSLPLFKSDSPEIIATILNKNLRSKHYFQLSA